MSARSSNSRIIVLTVLLSVLAALHFTSGAFPIPMEMMGAEAPAGIDTDGAPEEPKVKIVKSQSESGTPGPQAGTGSPAGKKRFLDMNTLSLYFGENDWNFIGLMTLRFVINILFAYIIISLIYAREHRIKELSFSFFVSNILIFMVTSLLASVRVRTGFAFGLFAILSILRYRTEQIQIREMTFLFVSIVLGVINSLATAELTIFAVLWANVILCICVYLCDHIFMGHTDQIILIYDNTRLLGKGMKQELHEDIKKRFGYEVVKVVIMKMNYLTDSAEVKLVYRRQ